MINRAHVIPPPVTVEQVSRFLDYLNVALSKLKFVSGLGEYLPDGGFREETRRIHTNSLDEGLELAWTIIMSSDGTLAHIEVTVQEGAPEGWEHVAEALIRETLIAVINNKQSIFLRDTSLRIIDDTLGIFALSGSNPSAFPKVVDVG